MIVIQMMQDKISLIIFSNFIVSKLKLVIINSCDKGHKPKYMENKGIKGIIGNTDIYLIDQIVKERYSSSETILDAGCGSGRNLYWFYNNNFTIFGIDQNKTQIKDLKKRYSKQKDHFSVSSLEKMEFEDDFFNHIICNAVLHFAKDKHHFKTMFSELLRVLKPGGSLFIRVASDIGIEDKIIPVSEGVYKLPDGTTRFLLNKSLFSELQNEHQFKMLETFKTVNVNDLRSMTTLVIQKN